MAVSATHDVTGGERAPRGPATSRERSPAPDVGRGFMLLLIALAHAPLYITTTGVGVMNHPDGGSTLDRAITFFGLTFVDNRAYPMFAALFGYGIATMAARQLAAGVPKPTVGKLLRRRSLYLILFGYLHYVLIFPADILLPYGVCGLLVGWLILRGRRAVSRALVISSLVAVVMVPLLTILVAMEESTELVRGTIWAENYGKAVLQRSYEAPLIALHLLLAWPILVAILVGTVAAAHRYLDDPAQHRGLLRRAFLLGGLVSVVGAVPMALIGAKVWEPADAFTIGLLETAHIATGLGGGVAYAAAFGLLATRLPHAGRMLTTVTRALAAVGRRALTSYLLQSAILALVLARVTFGLGDELHSTGALVVAVCAYLTILGLAIALERAGLPGPLDALLRRLVYGRRSTTGPTSQTSSATDAPTSA